MTRFPACLACGGLLLAATATAATAQTGAIPTAAEELLVRVDVTKVSDQLATHLGVGVDDLPRTVEMALGVAAPVCELKPEQLLLVRTVEQHVECNAALISEDLSEATRAEMLEDEERPTVESDAQ